MGVLRDLFSIGIESGSWRINLKFIVQLAVALCQLSLGLISDLSGN